MVWRSFEKTLPRDGQHILVLTRGCSASAAEAFFIKGESVDKYYKSGLISDDEKKQIDEINKNVDMAIAYGATDVHYPLYYVIVPIFSNFKDEVWTHCECFKWIPFPDEE